jgi:hypothetical protein
MALIVQTSFINVGLNWFCLIIYKLRGIQDYRSDVVFFLRNAVNVRVTKLEDMMYVSPSCEDSWSPLLHSVLGLLGVYNIAPYHSIGWVSMYLKIAMYPYISSTVVSTLGPGARSR